MCPPKGRARPQQEHHSTPRRTGRSWSHQAQPGSLCRVWDWRVPVLLRTHQVTPRLSVPDPPLAPARHPERRPLGARLRRLLPGRRGSAVDWRGLRGGRKMAAALGRGLDISLAALRQHDPYISGIVDVASQVALYTFGHRASQWVRARSRPDTPRPPRAAGAGPRRGNAPPPSRHAPPPGEV